MSVRSAADDVVQASGLVESARWDKEAAQSRFNEASNALVIANEALEASLKNLEDELKQATGCGF